MRIDAYYRALRDALIPAAGEAADYEAKELIGAVLGLSDREIGLYLHSGREMPAEAQKAAKAALDRRLLREPLEYILGYAWFYGYRFHVSADCLIPQADTEIVCEKVISRLKNGGRFADICTGSGCIALAALMETTGTTAIGYDISNGALAIAERNAKSLGVDPRFKARRADIFDPSFLSDAGEFDVIVSNPPYIETAVIETLSPEVRNEPHIALDGGADGLDFYRRLLAVCPAHIKKGGALLLEIGYDQRTALAALCDAHGFTYKFYRDFGGNDRVCAVLF